MLINMEQSLAIYGTALVANVLAHSWGRSKQAACAGERRLIDFHVDQKFLKLVYLAMRHLTRSTAALWHAL
jgi:hypothetical protein